MASARLTWTLVLLWLAAFALSFLHPSFVPATGDGFTRGLNRVSLWFYWQLAAGALSFAAAIAASRQLAQRKRLRFLAYAPLALQALLAAALVGLILYLRLSKPHPNNETDPATVEVAFVPADPFA